MEVIGYTRPYDLGSEVPHGLGVAIICEHATAFDFEMYWGNKPLVTTYFYWVETEADVDEREVVVCVPDEIVRKISVSNIL